MTIQIVCLDGTNEVWDQKYPTNIARIFAALGGAPFDADNGSLETSVTGEPALNGKYLPGVGSQGDPVLRVLGNAFGDGIAELIVRGYTYLSRNFTPGDEIIITGFSRGATAARALAGLVVGQGLMDRTRYVPSDKTSAYVRGIAAWYAYREPHPNFADQARKLVIEAAIQRALPVLTPADFTNPPTITSVAVFDTVSSLGLPLLTASGDAIFDFSLINTTLNDRVLSGFHALAADESRDLFAPTFWADREGVTQQVFPGCHSDVGGGFQNRGLSDAALAWMFEQLESIGLKCEPTKLNPPLAPDPLALAEDDGATPPFNLTPHSARAFPECAAPSVSLHARWNQLTEMLPSLAPRSYTARGTYADGSPLVR